MLAITSFSPAGYDLYGKRCLETFVEHWPCNIVVFHEGKPDFEHEKVSYIALESINDFSATVERMKRVAGSDGDMNGKYDYRWDANKFCRKVFAQDAAFDMDEEVFWLDADSVTHRPVPEGFLRGLIEGVPFAFYGRKDLYTETGFLGFKTTHPRFKEFRQKYLAQFTEGRIFENSVGWHDCIAFDIARQGIPGNNLSPDGRGVGNVMAAGPTSQYWTHYKGLKRKKIAKADAELYWAMRNDDLIKQDPQLEADIADSQ